MQAMSEQSSSCRTEESRASAAAAELLGVGHLQQNNGQKVFWPTRKCMQCAWLSLSLLLPISLSLPLFQLPAKLCNKKISFPRDTRHVAIALLLWPCCVCLCVRVSACVRVALSYFILHIIFALFSPFLCNLISAVYFAVFPHSNKVAK